MKCPKCCKEVPDTVKFCPECGYDIGEDNSVRLVQLRCKSCNGVMNIDTDKGIAVCPFCGATELIVESDEVLIEKDRNRTYKEIELQKLKHQKEMIENKTAEEDAVAYKKKLSSKLLLAWTIIVGFCAFAMLTEGSPAAGVVGLIQVALWVTSRLIGLGYIRPKYKKLRSVLVTIGFILTIGFCIGIDTSDTTTDTKVNTSETFTWPKTGLAAMLPEPEITTGHINRDSADSFDIDLYQVEGDAYRAYVEAVKESGFNIESYGSDNAYRAFNDEGYQVNMYYYTNDKKADVQLREPIELEELDWELSEASKMVPDPGKRVGNIDYESTDYSSIYVGETTKKDFKAYIKKCKSAGFSNDIYMSEDYFNAKNDDGVSLRLSYEGFNIMKINVTKE